LTVGVHINVTLHSANVESSERENLGELSGFKVRFLPQLLSVQVDNVSKFVDQVTFIVAWAAKVIAKTFLVLLRNDSTVSILAKLAHNILDVETFALIIK